MSDERLTTVSVYAADLEWLKQHQLDVSGQAKKWLPMPDIIRDLIQQAGTRQLDGIVMVPLIENLDAFNQRTAELRAQGFNREADARDKFAHRERS